ncbi:MAG: BlaI/MecI/CopY family transcriptional regulator, partial [Victivallaceae bacterium]
IIENVQKSNDWSKNTVATMLDRLVKKSAVNRSGNCRSYLYTAALPENEYKSAAVEKLAGQFFSGSVGAMFNFFAEDKKLTSEDVAEIKKLIEKMESQNDC